MSAPTVFLSAATVDLKAWRDLLHQAFSRAGFHVLTQDHSLGAAPGNVRRLLVEHIEQSTCVVHLAGMGYGAEADRPFPEMPAFQCSWTQFEYYYAHQQGRDVIALVCAPELSATGFAEKGDVAEVARKAKLQEAHRVRVVKGIFDGTPLAGVAGRTSNEKVDSVQGLLGSVAAAVGTLHRMDREACARAQEELQAVAGAVERVEVGVGSANEKLDRVLAMMAAGRAAPPSGPRHQLRPPPKGFVGRESDLAQLRQRSPERGAVVVGLRGMGGIGKTALALVLAHEWALRFPDAQLLLDARGTESKPESAEKLMERVILAFRTMEKPPDDRAALGAIYRDVLHGKRVLLLIDNARDAAQVAPLIPPEGCALIVTSRRNFQIGGEAPHTVGRLADAEAAVLLRKSYPALRDAETAALLKLCAGLPLALRLAGAHLALDASEREGGVADVAGYLKKLGGGRLETLDAEASDAGEVTISETLRLSEELLAEGERTAWRKLGIFTASFDGAAAANVAGAAEAMLGGWVRRSLVEREGIDRYKLHDLAAEYARDRMGEGMRAEVVLAHAVHYTKVAKAAEDLYLKGEVAKGLALFDRERGQIEAAVEGLVGRGDDSANRELIAMVEAVVFVGDLRFHSRQRIRWLEAQLHAAGEVADRRAEARAQGSLGNAYIDLGEAKKAIGYHERYLAIAREMGDRYGEGSALGNLGRAYASLGEAKKAIGYYNQHLVIAREIGDRRGEGAELGNLGNAYADLGETKKAIEYYEQRLVIAREIGDRRGEGSTLGNLGLACADLGKAQAAIGYDEQALVILREIGDRRGEDAVLGNLGAVYHRLGETKKAISYYEQALVIDREIGDRRGEGADLGNLGSAYADLGDAKKAMGYYDQQLIIARDIGDSSGEGIALFNSALAHHTMGQFAQAIELASAAGAILKAIESPHVTMVSEQLAQWRGEEPKGGTT